MGAIAYKAKIYGGSGSVEGLTDVNVTDVADGDILEYDAETEEWKNSNALSNKVDKVTGKDLSTNDYTDEDKDLVATIPNKADSKDISGSKSASGNPIIIEDSANAYAEKLIANIEPIQDLHGYDKPWTGGAGKNIAPITVEGIKALNSSATWTGNSCTINGVTFTILTNSANNVVGIKSVGTSTASIEFKIANVPFKNGVTYCISGAVSNPLNMNVTLFQKVSDSGSGVLYTSDTDENRRLLLYARSADIGKSVDVIFKPMVCVSNVIDTDFEPYTNMSPITGITQLDFSGCGHNLWDEEWELGIWNASGEKASTNSAIRSKNYIKVLGEETYYVKCSYASGLIVRELDSSKNVIKSTSVKNNTITTDVNTKYVVICSFTNDNITAYSNDISFNYPSTFTTYEPYTPNNHTLTLGRTVYGGKLNFQMGELVENKAIVDLGSLNWAAYDSTARIFSSDPLPATGIDLLCDAYNAVSTNSPTTLNNGEILILRSNHRLYARNTDISGPSAFKNAVTGFYAVYELATPITYYLTPEQVKLLKGYNYITTNADTLDIIYQPDNVLGEILGEAEGYTDRIRVNPVTILDDVAVSSSSVQYTIPDISKYTMLQFVLADIPAANVVYVRDTKTIPVSVLLHNIATYTYNHIITLLGIEPSSTDTWTECRIEMNSTTQISVSSNSGESPDGGSMLSIIAW